MLRSLCSITSFKRLWLAEHWQVTYSYRKIGHNYVIWKIDENWSVRPRNSHRIGVSESVRAKMQTHRAFVDGKSSSRQAGWHLIEPSVATTLTSHRTKPTQASQAREHASKSGLSTISHLCIPWIIRESNQIPCVIILYPDSCQHIAACNGAAASTPFTSPRSLAARPVLQPEYWPPQLTKLRRRPNASFRQHCCKHWQGFWPNFVAQALQSAYCLKSDSSHSPLEVKRW